MDITTGEPVYMRLPYNGGLNQNNNIPLFFKGLPNDKAIFVMHYDIATSYSYAVMKFDETTFDLEYGM